MKSPEAEGKFQITRTVQILMEMVACLTHL